MQGKQNRSVRYRIPLLVMAFICLLLGIDGGLIRLGWLMPLPAPSAVTFHGPLIVCGFLGTVISLERAVAAGKRWAYIAPLMGGLGGLALIAEVNWLIGASLITVASGILSITTLDILKRQRELFTLTLLLACLSWLVGNLLWLYGHTVAQVAIWWIGFLVLTIAGERLELSRLLPTSVASKISFMLIVGLFLVGAIVASYADTLNVSVSAIALLALAFWLLRNDLARHTIKQQGLTRFVAICLISGYVWLVIGGLIGLYSPQLTHLSYDAFLHAIMLGFVFSMIFGHAPIIFPAVAKIKISYHPSFYLPLLTLHISVMVRIAGDLLANTLYRQLGGALNGIALLLFFITLITAIARSQRQST